jgi:hypothetical protein
MNPKIKLEKDFLDFIGLCNKYEVEYLVVGGYAVAIHGYPRYTKDLDVSIRISAENAEAMLTVIKEFGFASLNLTIEDFKRKEGFIQLRYEPLRIDIINDLDGVPFEKAFKNKKVIVYDDVPINFINYDDLIENKKKAGRSQDLVDIEKLNARNKNK